MNARKRITALGESFRLHAKRMTLSGTCKIEVPNGRGGYCWISTSNAPEVNQAIRRCLRNAHYYGCA